MQEYWITAGITAQAPQKMSYQAIIRDGKDSLVRNQRVSLRISILQDSINGNVVYKEDFYPMPLTNMNGLITVEIGTGIKLTGTFAGIDWSDGPYFMKTEVDPAGNTSYPVKTVSQLLSVPYALHAKTAENLTGDVAAYLDAVLAKVEAIEKHLNFYSNVLIDSRDGTSYKTVKIGEQLWMAENLKYLPELAKPYSYSDIIPHYYVNDYYGTDINVAKTTENYKTYGVLYNWPAAMNGAEVNSNQGVVQGICPSGWHLPDHSEWEQLINYLGGDSIAGGKLKETGLTHWKSPNTGATNESGFTALPGSGYMNYEGFEFWTPGYYSIWWSSSWNDLNPDQNFTILSSENSGVDYWSGWWSDLQTMKAHGVSVRCVKD